MFVVSNQKEESISIQRVKGGLYTYVISTKILRSDPEVIKLFMLNSTEHEISTAHKN